MSVKSILSAKNIYLVKSSLNSRLSLSPFSQQIKENLANEWIKFNRRVLSLELFVTPLSQNSDSLVRSEINSFKHNYKNHYSEWSDTTSQPFGVFQKSVYQNQINDNSVLDSTKSDSLVFALFSPKQQSLQLFRKIQTFHNHWFRNLSRSPLNSDFKTLQYEQDDIQCSINHKTEDIDHTVEDMVFYRNSSAEEKFGITNCDLILCNLNLDNSLLSFLCDAFTLKTLKSGKTVRKLKLNSSIAPIKIAFLFRDINQINDRMIEMIQHMIEMLHEFQIPILPFFLKKPITTESCDEMGIPFTVIVDEKCLQKGVIALRNRDTEIEEWVHISSFQKTVCLYLKAIHPSIVRNKAIN